MEPKPGTETRNSVTSTVTSTNSTAGIIATGNVTARDVYLYNAFPQNEFPLPRVIDTFQGRGDEIAELDKAFFTQKVTKVVICGLGGFGKSELAKQYAQKCLETKKFETVLWIPSENQEELNESYKKLKHIYDNYAAKQLLCIFDNCISQRSIADYEPYGNKNHRVLITSQNKYWSSDAITIELHPLSSTSALQVFKLVFRNKYRDEDVHLYKKLANSVNNTPLGLQIIAAYILDLEDEGIKLEEYVDEIIKSKINIINQEIPESSCNSYSKSIYSAMLTSLNRIQDKKDQKREIRELALDVLGVSAYLDPDSILTGDLLCIINMKDINHQYNEKQLHCALKLLLNFSFVHYVNEEKTEITQHRITQLFFRYYLREFNFSCNYFRQCLNWVIEERGTFHRIFRQLLSIINYADSYITTVHNFYIDHKMHIHIGQFLGDLIRYECNKSITTIFENPDEQTKKKIFQHDLLAMCALKKNVNLLNVLLRCVDDINGKNDNKETALHVLTKWPNGLQGIEILISQHGIKLNVRNGAGDTPLFTYVRHTKEPQKWSYILQIFEFDINVTNHDNQSLFHLAVACSQAGLVNILIENYRSGLNQTDNKGWTPLDILYNAITVSSTPFSYINDNKTILLQLLRHGATSKKNHETNNGDTCHSLLLNYASQFYDVELLKLLDVKRTGYRY